MSDDHDLPVSDGQENHLSSMSPSKTTPPLVDNNDSVGKLLDDLKIVPIRDWREAVATVGENVTLEKILLVLRVRLRKWRGCRTPASLVTLYMAEIIEAGISNISRLRVGKYVLRKSLGEGGYGEVFQVVDPEFGMVFAMKRVSPSLLSTRPDETLSRFRREVEANHEANCIGSPKIFETNFECTPPYFTMDFVEGTSLDKLIKERCSLRDADPILARKPLFDFLEAIRIARDAARILNDAHQKKIIHRDVKPENLMQTTFDDEKPLLKLIDFGLAKLPTLTEDQFKTRAGKRGGTAAYYVGMDVSSTATARTPCPLAPTAYLHPCRRNTCRRNNGSA
ncbi:MAG: serine/threonine protein kinase [Planctomycetia bacterium]